MHRTPLFFVFLLIFGFTVANPPKLDEFRTTKSLKEGTKFSIICTILEGSSPFEIEWQFNDHLLNAKSNSDYRIDQIEDDQFRFTISKLNANHSGSYSCIARNDFGFDRQTTHLTVTGLSYLQFPLAINVWRIRFREKSSNYQKPILFFPRYFRFKFVYVFRIVFACLNVNLTKYDFTFNISDFSILFCFPIIGIAT